MIFFVGVGKFDKRVAKRETQYCASTNTQAHGYRAVPVLKAEAGGQENQQPA